MHHYVYCIENLVNGKVYVGKHSTDNFDDGYMGSGKLVTKAIARHGLENFKKHILQEFETSEEAYVFEKFLVNEEFISDENTYNLTCGGSGSFAGCNEFLRLQPEIRKSISSIGNRVLWKNIEFRKRVVERPQRRW